MLCKGVGSYVGGFPAVSNATEIEDLKIGYAFIGYISGIIVLTIAGGCVQMKKEKDKDDDFMNADNM